MSACQQELCFSPSCSSVSPVVFAISQVENVEFCEFHMLYTGVPGEKINILGGHSIGHSKKKAHEHVSIPNGFRYLARSIFLPSHSNAPLSEACESV
jgi:hypothetical protein